MSWLIDAEVLIDDIENNGDKAIIDMIEAQPIAFDLDKVIKDLEVLHDLVRQDQMLVVSQAIEIVKRGVSNE